jgi:thiol-disulfide isomerase/thioredoxin
MKKYLFLPLVVLMLSSFQLQSPYELNDAIPNFSLINALDNNPVSLKDFGKSKAIVIIFSSPSCAFSKIYDDRLVQLANEFQNKEVSFIMINPNNPSIDPDDTKDAMTKRANDKGYPFPYLIDNNQKIATSFGATKTPEVFVLKNVNGAFVLKYKGAIDDNPQLASDVSASYLRDAIHSVVTNTPVKISEKRTTGCTIKK